MSDISFFSPRKLTCDGTVSCRALFEKWLTRSMSPSFLTRTRTSPNIDLLMLFLGWDRKHDEHASPTRWRGCLTSLSEASTWVPQGISHGKVCAEKPFNRKQDARGGGQDARIIIRMRCEM